MIGVLVVLNLFFSLYVYCLQRICIVGTLRKKHSNTYLKKLKKNSTRIKQLTGLYLLDDNILQEKWLKFSVYAANLNLLWVAVFWALAIAASFGNAFIQGIMKETYRILTLKDLAIWFLLTILMIKTKSR